MLTLPLLLFGILGPPPVFSFTVNSTTDAHDANPGDAVCQTSTPGVCTLRAAVEESNETSNVLIDVPAGTLALSLGELLVTRPMTIAGAGMKKTILVASPSSRVFSVAAQAAVLRLTDVTLKDGNTAGGGGAIAVTYLAGLEMERCQVTSCRAASGGAVFSVASISLTDCVLSDNRATSGGGGAVELFASADGAAYAQLLRTTLAGNLAAGAGGGLHQGAGYGSLAVHVSTISGNTSGGPGGGMRVDGGAAVVDYATITNNATDTHEGGGGLSHGGAAGAVSVHRTILAGNYAAFGQVLLDSDCQGPCNVTTGSIVGPNGQAGCTLTGGFVSAYPLLGVLRDNGGRTPTHALLAGSPGLDAGCGSRSDPISTDQRGVYRPIGGLMACDLGAYERAPCGDANGDGLVTVSDVFFLINHLFAGGALPPGLADANGDGERTVGDVFHLVNYLFAGGPPPSCPGT